MIKAKMSLLFLKSLSLAAGIFFLYSSIIFILSTDILSNLYFPAFVSFFIAAVSIMLSIILISEFFSSIHVKFRRPTLKETKNPVYGFVTLFAIGLGTTIGSPLFILIPENIYQYVYVSIISLVIAIGMSFLLAYLYSKMGQYSYKNNIEAFGGPSFIRSAYGRGSVRYFISRFSMWIANTALAAFSVIYFLDFDLTVIPSLLKSAGLNVTLVNAVIIFIIIAMIVWFIINAFFEKKFMRTIGHIQIVFLVIMISIIFFDALDLGFRGSWNMSGIFDFHGSVLSDTIMNTGYLFILFFGYQEIQVMERDSREESSIPIISAIVHHRFSKPKYIPASMYSVIAVAGVFQILYALAIFSLHASESAINSAVIPAIYVASSFQNSTWAILIAISFLLATLTTFVPAFMAASRHLRSLAEDNIFPQSFAGFSWVFTLVAIIIMTTAGGSFLVNITDFMVLISLSLIALTGTRLREISGKRDRVFYISIITFGIFIFAAANIYLLDKTVVILGIIAIIISYLIYDIMKIGLQGIELFSLFLGLLSVMMSLVFETSIGKSLLILGYFNLVSPYGIHFIQLSIAVMIVLILMNAVQRIRIRKVLYS